MEKRVGTILSVDYRNSTGRIADLSADDALAFIDEKISIMIGEIEGHGGAVMRLEGDGIVAFFGGLNQAQSVAMACKCAIAIRESFGSEKHETLHAIRIGINTGEVIVNRFSTRSRSFERLSGMAMHVTSRMEQQCKPGEIMISEQSRILLDSYSEDLGARFVDAGAHRFDGVPGAHRVFIYTRGKPENSPDMFTADMESQFPFIDMPAIQSLVARLVDAELDLVQIQGRSGCGKSTLLNQLYGQFSVGALIDAREGQRLTPYVCLLDMLTQILSLRSADLGDEDGIAERVAYSVDVSRRVLLKLSRLIHQVYTLDVNMPRAEMVDVLIEVLNAFDRELSLGVLIDNFDNVDDESREVLKSILADGRPLNASFIVTCREPTEICRNQAIHRMSGIEPADRHLLFGRLLGHRGEPGSRHRQIVDLCNNNLWLIRAFAIAEKTALSSRAALPVDLNSSDPDAIATEDNLYMLAGAQVLQGISPVSRRLIEILAVCREDASVECIEHVAGEAVSGAIAETTGTGLLRWAGEKLTLSNRQIGALLRRSMLASDIGRIARKFIDYHQSQSQPADSRDLAELAYYAALIEDRVVGFDYLYRYAGHCVEHKFLNLAVRLYGDCCSIYESDAGRKISSETYAGILIELAGILSSIENEAEEAIVMEKLDRVIEDDCIENPELLYRYCACKAVYLSHKGAMEDAEKFGRDSIDYAARAGNDEGVKKSVLITGHVMYHAGKYSDAYDMLDSFRENELLTDSRLISENSLYVRSLAVSAGCLAYLGSFEQAKIRARQSVEFSRSANNIIDYGVSVYFLSLICRKTGEHRSVEKLLDDALTISRRDHLRYIIPWLLLEKGLSVSRIDSAIAEKYVREAISIAEHMRLRYLLCLCFCCYATVLRRKGHFGKGRRYSIKSVDLAVAYGYSGLKLYAIANIALCKGLEDPGHRAISCEHLDTALFEAESRGMKPLVAKIWAYKAHILAAEDIEESRHLLKTAIRLHNDIGLHTKAISLTNPDLTAAPSDRHSGASPLNG